MENTIENKEKFFALYWGQEIGNYQGFTDFKVGSGVLSINMIESVNLKPLSSISDEDAIEVAKICSFHDGEGMLTYLQNDRISMYDKYEDEPHKKNVLHLFHESFEIFSLDDEGRVFEYDMERILNVCDYLRSKGYAIPFMGLFVEEQISRGWVRLSS